MPELKPIHRRPGIENLAAWLKSKGYRRIASGSFAEVYEHPNRPGVVKVWPKFDDGYSDYVSHILDNQHLAAAPQVYGDLVEFPDAKEGWPERGAYALRMERLDPRPEIDDENAIEYDDLVARGYGAILADNLPTRPMLWRLKKWRREDAKLERYDMAHGPNKMLRYGKVEVITDPYSCPLLEEEGSCRSIDCE